MRDLSIRKPLTLAVAAGATSPAGLVGAEIWSTVENAILTWDGTHWINLALKPVGDFFEAIAGENIGAFKAVSYVNGQLFLWDSDDGSSFTNYVGITTQAYSAGDLARAQVRGTVVTPFTGAGKNGGVFVYGNTADGNEGSVTFGGDIPSGGIYSCLLVGFSEYESGVVYLTSPSALFYVPQNGNGVNVTVYDGITAYTNSLSVDLGGTGAKTSGEALENLGGQPKIPYGTPASSGATGNMGERSWDLENDYLSVNINSWVKMPHIALDHSVVTTTETSSVDGDLAVFSGANGKVVKKSDVVRLPVANPATPLPDNLLVYSGKSAGRMQLMTKGPSGIPWAVQPALFGATVGMMIPNTGATTPIGFGVGWVIRNSGTGAAQSHPTLSATSTLTSMSRALYSTGTTTSGASGIAATNATMWRGNAAGKGGFFCFFRFAAESYSSSTRIIVGLSSENGTLTGQPSARYNLACIGADSGDTTWHFMTRSAAGAATRTDTGVPLNSGVVYDLLIHCTPNSSEILMELQNSETGALVASITATATLPLNTAFLAPQALIMSTSGTNAKSLAVNRIYYQTDI